MTLQEVADYLHCSYATALRFARRGDMLSFKLRGGWRVMKSEIDKWIESGGGGQPYGSAPAKRGGGRPGRIAFKARTTKS
jgi:excisionase family DNA binding protein